MNKQETETILAEIKYKPGWNLSYWWENYLEAEMLNFRWQFWAQDAYSSQMVELTSHKIASPFFFDEEQLVREVFALAQRAEMHECAEFFTYKGERPFDPHKSVLEAGGRYSAET